VILRTRRERPTATVEVGVLEGLSEAIRPAAVVPVAATRRILMALADLDVRRGGCWSAVPGAWRRFDRPWAPELDLDLGERRDPVVAPELMGTIRCIYDRPSRHMTTLYRVDVTAAGLDRGWTVERLCDEALSYAGLSIATCGRDEIRPVPRSFKDAEKLRA